MVSSCSSNDALPGPSTPAAPGVRASSVGSASSASTRSAGDPGDRRQGQLAAESARRPRSRRRAAAARARSPRPGRPGRYGARRGAGRPARPRAARPASRSRRSSLSWVDSSAAARARASSARPQCLLGGLARPALGRPGLPQLAAQRGVLRLVLLDLGPRLGAGVAQRLLGRLHPVAQPGQLGRPPSRPRGRPRRRRTRPAPRRRSSPRSRDSQARAAASARSSSRPGRAATWTATRSRSSSSARASTMALPPSRARRLGANSATRRTAAGRPGTWGARRPPAPRPATARPRAGRRGRRTRSRRPRSPVRRVGWPRQVLAQPASALGSGAPGHGAGHQLDRVGPAAPAAGDRLDGLAAHLGVLDDGVAGEVDVPELHGAPGPRDVEAGQVAAPAAPPTLVGPGEARRARAADRVAHRCS